MPSSRSCLGLAAFVVVGAFALSSEAQQQPQGFAVERLYQSAPGAGWFVMDALDMGGALGGVMALSLGYAHDPLRVRSSDGARRLAVVSDQAAADFGFAVTHDRWRLYLNLDMPLVTQGQSGTLGGYEFTAPAVDPGTSPDRLSDARVGVDARLVGDASSAFRLGAGAQLFIPNGNTCYEDTSFGGTVHRCDYDTDGTFRAMGRVLLAGDVGLVTYAGQVGVHVRPRDDWPTPGAPEGSELLFGAAGGVKVPAWPSARWVSVVGAEVYGTTAFRDVLGSSGTALEALLSARIEGSAEGGAQLRLKLGGGPGIVQRFGAPEWRVVVAVELFDRGGDRDHAP